MRLWLVSLLLLLTLAAVASSAVDYNDDQNIGQLTRGACREARVELFFFSERVGLALSVCRSVTARVPSCCAWSQGIRDANVCVCVSECMHGTSNWLFGGVCYLRAAA